MGYSLPSIGLSSVRMPLEAIASKACRRSIITSLIPSFLNNPKNRKVHPTSWLDGVRGYASLFVFLFHFQHAFNFIWLVGYGSEDRGGNNYGIVQLPIIRLAYAGQANVAIFWVLSGMSLSLKPIQLARSKSWDKFLDTMFSAIFRRGMRLYIPVLFVQICVVIAACLGFYDYAWATSQDWPFEGVNEAQFEVFPSCIAQIQDWVATMLELLNPFKHTFPKYDIHLWTIQREFQYSIILFVALVGFAKLRPRIRVTLTAALFAYCMKIGEGDIALFIAGMGLAEFLQIRTDYSEQLPSVEKLPEENHSLTALWSVLLYIGLHLLSWPYEGADTSPGYIALSNAFTDFNSEEDQRQIIGDQCRRMGAAVFLFALCGCEWFRKPFMTNTALYLGRISFPLYIIHGPINHIIGHRMVEFFWNFTGNQTPFTYAFGISMAFIICAAIVIWLADIVSRVIDAPSVRFGRFVQEKWSC
jgi:peptidoglycan/LPS O-acetylase OafA/YrhL